MATHPPPEPLRRSWTLNGDILLHILDLQVIVPHTSNLNTPALNLTFRCSQVCRQWRSQILHAPLLWAKLIDINALRDTSDDWKYEVLRRTGNAPMWVSASIAEKQRGYPFFLWLLDKHWERIQVLYLGFTVVTNRAPDPRWKAMQRPSSHLRICDIRIYHTGLVTTLALPLELVPPTHLLSGGIPNLHRLVALGGRPFTIQIQIPSLRSLELRLGYSSSSPDKFSTLLAALRSLINLEYLELAHDHFGDRVHTGLLPLALSSTSLPRLSVIKYQGPYTIVALILSQLRPAPGCSIFIRSHASINPEVLPAAEDVLNTYSQNFWAIHQSQYVEMAIDENHFKIHPWQGSLPAVYSNYHLMGYLYESDRSIYEQEVVPEFSIYLFPRRPIQNGIDRTLFALTCVPRSIFSTITHLHISKFSLGTADPGAVVQLINALVCVEVLVVPLDFFQVIPTTLEMLIGNNDAVSAHLPALKVLKIRYGESLEREDFMPFVNYANLRRSAGLAPLDTLDLEDMEAKVVMPLTELLLHAANTVLYPGDKYMYIAFGRGFERRR